jgi:hypothetical protein
MASQRLPVSLALAITPSGTTQDRHRNPCFDPPKGEFKLGNGRYCYPLTVSDHASRFMLLC